MQQHAAMKLTGRASERRQKPHPNKGRERPTLRQAAPFFTVVVLLTLWQVTSALGLYPPFILPPPLEVAEKFYDVLMDGSLLRHTWVTLSEVLLGLLIGLSVGMTLGYMIARVPLLEDIFSPVIVALQSTPTVAYAPLLVIWFDNGLLSKVVITSLIVFFPTLMNTVVGVRNVPPSLQDLMLSLRATRWQTFVKLEVPAAMPVLMGGLKISATLAVIGAVVGEFVGARAGLGFLINIGRSQYDTPLVLVAVIMLAIMARSLYGLVGLLEGYVLRWQSRTH